MECLWDQDPGVANRAAHALERVTREGPIPVAILNPWRTSLLGLLSEASENKLRWHLALIIPRLALDPLECRRAAEALQAWLGDQSSSIVKTMSMQGLADLTRQDASLLPMVVDLLRVLSRTGTPAMRARGRMLLLQMEAANEHTPVRVKRKLNQPPG
jgi:hypothetical protein